jgi:hypothetical protein
MIRKNKNLLTVGVIFIALAALSFILLLLKLPTWFAWFGIGFLAVGAILIASCALPPKPAASNTPPPASDLLHNAQQSAPQPALKERQPQQERAFPPSDQSTDHQ